MNPSISVIVPVYNAQVTLRQCVDSVLSQNNACFELILVDDGSTDDSSDICDEYREKDSRVIVIHKQNGGVSSARNAALDIAKGEWITFVDSDDYISDDYFLTSMREGYDLIVNTKVMLFNDSWEKESTPIQSFESRDIKSIGDYLTNYLNLSIFRTPWAKFYKRNFIGDIRFKEDMHIAEDACFVYDYLLKIDSLIVLSGSCYHFRDLGIEEHFKKYRLGVNDSKHALKHLFESYKPLEIKYSIGYYIFYNMLVYFKKISKEEWSQNLSLWYGDKYINSLYKIIWDCLHAKEKITWLLLNQYCYFFR